MKKSVLFRFLCVCAIVLNISALADAQNLTLPYFCGFEDPVENSQWTLNAGPAGNSAANKWYVSHAEVYAGDSALNISSNGGTTAAYGNTTVAIVAYRTITLPAGTYDLSFTYYAGGESNLDGLYACWVNGTQTTNSSAMSAPSWVNSTAFTINSSKMQSLTGGWQVATQSITSTGAPMKLVFVWVNNGSTNVPPGGCIDNVQISKTACGKPTNVTATANGGSITVTWSGNASSYDLMYRSYGNSGVTTVTGITGNSYTINGLGEGLYDFMVRSNCNGDTSIYVIAQNVIVYDAAAHCIDYVNLTATGTTCTYGSYTNPKQTTGVIDNGPSQMSSRHTVHFTPGETDPRTGNGLTTIPKGEVMAVRLGNWNTGSEAETVTYTYTVPANSNVIMILKYAVVFEEPGHDEPPEFNMQITNLQGQSIGTCTEATFLCDGTLTDASWHVAQDGYSNIYWKEWTQVGFNLSQYAGQTLRICFTTKDCNWSGHYGYAYYCLSCTEAQITGLSCGDALEARVSAPEGFNYQWYKKSTPSVIVGTDQEFSVTGTDTSTYVCKVINKANPACFFTLEASLLPRNPLSQFTPQWQPSNCQNIVLFQNTSSVVTSRGVTSEQPEFYKWFIVDSINNDTIVNGIGTTSPTVTFPNEGGDYIVELITGISNGACQDTMHMLYHVQEIHEVYDTINEQICQGQVYMFNGQRLSATGQYVSSVKALGGCDSVVTLNLTVMDQIEVDTYDSICDGETYTFNGSNFTKAGEYKAKLKSSAGCDSIVTLHLHVWDPVIFNYVSVDESGAPNTGSITLTGMQPGWRYTVNGVDSGRLDSLSSGHYLIQVYSVHESDTCISDVVDVELKRVCVDARFPDVPQYCTDDAEGFAQYRLLQGKATTYNIKYSQAAIAEGFVDVDSLEVDSVNSTIKITMPDGRLAWADKYKAEVYFNDVICGPTKVDFEFIVNYSKLIIEQKWNDVLAVLNEKYNYEGKNPGYEFAEFQWYKNGAVIPGEIGPYLYIGKYGEVFDNADSYSVELKRKNENYSIMSCPMNPVTHTDNISVVTLCNSCAMIHLPSARLELNDIETEGEARWYTVSGQLCSVQKIGPDNMVIETPNYGGVYMLVVEANGMRQTFKVMIKD